MGRVSDFVKQGLRRWTQSMAREDLEAKLIAGRAHNEYGVDSFGFSLDYALSAIAPLVWLYRNYFRVETHHIGRVPPGRVLLIGNHSGQLPFDAMMIGTALLLEADPPRPVRSMVEKWVPTLPWVSTIFARIGQVVGTPENCRRLLENEEAVLIFPEGVRGIAKLWHERYQLREFGLGFMRLALETNTPVVPFAVIGAEEQAPSFANLAPLARVLSMPVFPLTPLGLPLPLPTKYRLHFGEPLRFSGRADDDDAELEKKVTVVRSAVQELVEIGLRERQAVFW